VNAVLAGRSAGSAPLIGQAQDAGVTA
jgi:hypothetical protein